MWCSMPANQDISAAWRSRIFRVPVGVVTLPDHMLERRRELSSSLCFSYLCLVLVIAVPADASQLDNIRV